MRYDVFLSHASEDKHQVALPLMDRLVRRGFRVWLDEFELTVGDSLRRSIDKGLSEASFGIVILSPSYLNKVWTNRELDGLVARDNGSRPLILPIWHNLSKEEVLRYSPTLADKIAVSTEFGLDYVSEQIVKAMERGDATDGSNISGISLLSRKSDELADLRRKLLSATSRFDLEHLLYEVDEFLIRYPGDPEARLLRERIRSAYRPLARKPVSKPKPPARKPRPIGSDYRRFLQALIAALTVIVLLALVRTCPKVESPPNPTAPADRKALLPVR